MPRFVKVAKESEIQDQTGKCVDIEGRRIALFNLGGEFFAIDDTCTHRGGPLSEGDVVAEKVKCPWHGARFSIKSGEVVGPPAVNSVTKYTVRVTGDDIEIEL